MNDPADRILDDIPSKPAKPSIGLLPGWTVQLLTDEQARAELSEMYGDDPDEPYFNELPAHGNANWVDYWPDMVLVVRDAEGDVVTTSNASGWHMRAHGIDVPEAIG